MKNEIIKALTIILGLSCSTWAVNCPPGVTISTEAVAIMPSNRTRTKIGVGEEIKLTLNPSPSSTVTWSISSGKGSLSSLTGNPVRFTAHEQADNPTISASYDDYTCEVKFEIIEPSLVTMEFLGGAGSAPPLSMYG